MGLNKFISYMMLVLPLAAFADSNNDMAFVSASPAPAAAATPATSATVPSASALDGNSINPAALAAMESQQQAAMMNMAMSAALFASCLATKPPTMPLCVMGGLAAMQSGADGAASGMSGNTAGTSQNLPPGAGTAATEGSGGTGTTTGAYSNPTVAAGMQTLSDNGYAVTGNGVTNPDGSSTPASTFSSPSAMAAAGIDQKTIDASQAAIAAANKGAAVKVSSVGVSEGGGATAGDPGNYADGGSFSHHLTNPFALSGKDKKGIVAGKTVLLEGEPIGVKGQNLFDMVHVAYQRKREGNHFIESDSGGVNVRAPASTNVNPRINNR